MLTIHTYDKKTGFLGTLGLEQSPYLEMKYTKYKSLEIGAQLTWCRQPLFVVIEH